MSRFNCRIRRNNFIVRKDELNNEFYLETTGRPCVMIDKKHFEYYILNYEYHVDVEDSFFGKYWCFKEKKQI